MSGAKRNQIGKNERRKKVRRKRRTGAFPEETPLIDALRVEPRSKR